MSYLPLNRLSVFNDIYNLGLTSESIKTLTDLGEKYKEKPARGNSSSDRSIYYVVGRVLENRLLCLDLGSGGEQVELKPYRGNNIPENSYVWSEFIFNFEPSSDMMTCLWGSSGYHPRSFVLNYSQEDPLISFDTENSFKEYIIQNFNNFGDLDNAPSCYYNGQSVLKFAESTNSLYKTLVWLFSLKEFPEITYTYDKTIPWFMSKIEKVYELNNYRIALYVPKPTDHRQGNHITLETYCINEQHPAYNYTDVGMLCGFPGADRVPKLFIQGNVSDFPDQKTCQSTIRGQRFVLLDTNALKLAKRRAIMEETEEREKQEMTKILQQRLANKISAASDKTKNSNFAFNDISVKDNEFTYAEQTVRDDTGLISIHDVCARISSRQRNGLTPENFNFDILFDHYCDTVVTSSAKVTMRGQIGEATYILRQESSSAGTALYYINDIRINKDEVKEVIKHALCYRTTAEYTKFVRSVSLCSLRFHRFLSTGIDVSVHDPIKGINLIFRLFLQRIRNKNYLIIKDKQFKISDTNRILTLLNARDMPRVIEVLLDPGTVGVSGVDIRVLIEDGVRQYEELKKQEQAMLENALQKLGIERIENPQLNASNAVIDVGYLVKGKLRTYLVTDEDTPKTYDYPSGSYRCIVEKNSGQYSKIQKLLARFYNLVNDSAVVDLIHTLK